MTAGRNNIAKGGCSAMHSLSPTAHYLLPAPLTIHLKHEIYVVNPVAVKVFPPINRYATNYIPQTYILTKITLMSMSSILMGIECRPMSNLIEFGQEESLYHI